MKIAIKRPKVQADMKESGMYTIDVRDVSLLSALLLKCWLSNTGVCWKVSLDTSQLNPNVLNKDIYIPSIPDREQQIEYIKTAMAVLSTIYKSKVDPKYLFGLIPMNILVSFQFETTDLRWESLSPKNELKMFEKRNDRWEFPVSDFGYLLEAIEKSKKECVS